MARFQIVPPGTKIPFIPYRKVFLTFSVLLVLASVGLYLARGLNFGIDFEGGILMEVRTEGAADIPAMRDSLGSLGLGEINLQEFGQPTDVLIRIQKQEGGEEAQQIAIETVRESLGDTVTYRRTEFVGPKVGEELKQAGILAVLLSIAGMLLYIWFRFEWQFGIAAVIALSHDVLSTIGIFALLQLEFNLATVAAILTIAGYSINDTVVVFDRIRENLRKFKKMVLADVLNRSINETLSRTVLTSVTTLLALLALFTLGGPVIRDFSFAMIWGVVIGTYSSICVAAPLLLYMKLKRTVFESDEDDTPKTVEVGSEPVKK
ncbi:MAG: protein translocase subunit SecF [Alphaproteobacteria bacterium]|nr:protein translocase subunit SecF [Alphaproteobacteria bacterium]